MRAWQFSKPKNPGFGISSNFYLSVLSSRATMPALLDLIEPAGTRGAVTGFGAPLASNATKESLLQPMARGAYVLASKDRKSVLKMLVLSKEEAGFDPEAFARSSMAENAGAEMINRIRATWTLAQLTFQTHDPMVYPALDFLLSLCVRLGQLADGVIADPIARRYLLPEEVIQPARLDPRVDAREHVTTNFRERPDGIHAYTLGLQKFSLPELEIGGLFEVDSDRAARLLLSVAETVLLGSPLKERTTLGGAAIPFTVREGGFDSALWEGVHVFELVPPVSALPSEALDDWEGEVSRLAL